MLLDAPIAFLHASRKDQGTFIAFLGTSRSDGRGSFARRIEGVAALGPRRRGLVDPARGVKEVGRGEDAAFALPRLLTVELLRAERDRTLGGGALGCPFSVTTAARPLLPPVNLPLAAVEKPIPGAIAVDAQPASHVVSTLRPVELPVAAKGARLSPLTAGRKPVHVARTAKGARLGRHEGRDAVLDEGRPSKHPSRLDDAPVRLAMNALDRLDGARVSDVPAFCVALDVGDGVDHGPWKDGRRAARPPTPATGSTRGAYWIAIG